MQDCHSCDPGSIPGVGATSFPYHTEEGCVEHPTRKVVIEPAPSEAIFCVAHESGQENVVRGLSVGFNSPVCFLNNRGEYRFGNLR